MDYNQTRVWSHIFVFMFCRILVWCLLLNFLLPCVSVGQNFFGRDDYGDVHTFIAGVVAGLNFSQVNGDGHEGYHKAGLNGGGVIYVRISDHIGISAELLYSEKGSKMRHVASDLGYAQEYDIKLNYAEVPLMVYLAPDFAGSRFHFRGGLSYGRLLQSTERASNSVVVNMDPATFPFRKYDIDWLADVSYMTYDGLFLSLRYSYSLLPIRERAAIPPGYGEGPQFNNLLSLRLMYLLK